MKRLLIYIAIVNVCAILLFYYPILKGLAFLYGIPLLILIFSIKYHIDNLNLGKMGWNRSLLIPVSYLIITGTYALTILEDSFGFGFLFVSVQGLSTLVFAALINFIIRKKES